jgi:hypothetical protein
MIMLVDLQPPSLLRISSKINIIQSQSLYSNRYQTRKNVINSAVAVLCIGFTNWVGLYFLIFSVYESDYFHFYILSTEVFY